MKVMRSPSLTRAALRETTTTSVIIKTRAVDVVAATATTTRTTAIITQVKVAEVVDVETAIMMVASKLVFQDNHNTAMITITTGNDRL